MLNTTEGSFLPFGDAAAGSLALVMGYNEGLAPILVVGAGQERQALLLEEAREWSLVNLDHRDQVLDLGAPIVRYDPGSRRTMGRDALAGGLIWVDGRFGFRAAGGYRSGMSGWETPAAWLDGTVSMHHHAYEHLAFSLWEVGIARDDAFVSVASTARSDDGANEAAG